MKHPPTTPSRPPQSPTSGQARGDIHIGISGWRYVPWRGDFYPTRWPQRLELPFASRMLSSIEINGSFYALQRPASYLSWRADTPDDFVFSVKGPSFITHTRRLKDVRTPLANFFASGVLALGPKLGPLLWQFPPSLAFDAERFDAFFGLLPHDTTAAHALAHEHDGWMTERGADRVALDAPAPAPLRHAIEIRHPSFVDVAFIDLLRRHKLALVIADTAGKWPQIEDLTADFAYLRLHGDKKLYASGYTDTALDRWAARVHTWAQGGEPDDAQRASPKPALRRAQRDVFCYFDNDIKVRAPYDAARLAQRLGVPNGLGGDGRFDPPPGLREGG